MLASSGSHTHTHTYARTHTGQIVMQLSSCKAGNAAFKLCVFELKGEFTQHTCALSSPLEYAHTDSLHTLLEVLQMFAWPQNTHFLIETQTGMKVCWCCGCSDTITCMLPSNVTKHKQKNLQKLQTWLRFDKC